MHMKGMKCRVLYLGMNALHVPVCMEGGREAEREGGREGGKWEGRSEGGREGGRGGGRGNENWRVVR